MDILWNIDYIIIIIMIIISRHQFDRFTVSVRSFHTTERDVGRSIVFLAHFWDLQVADESFSFHPAHVLNVSDNNETLN
ncbi:hypothetical protein BpHYR1_042698 [Brachionus plicatilis]|uniref:Uncharacterized protein n=1 Tax=Brachionus plicatilis TaxID=10195 RepID=A0A3M7SAK4_BRAPC|nr:hypothetical protein BpHYR1_042698 [Brachionus plicatilis]